MALPNDKDTFTVVLKFKKENPIAGACKFAYFGESSTPIFWPSPSTKICIKEASHIAPQTENRILYDAAKQAEILTTEMNCSRWANPMMKLAYDFVERENEKHGELPFPIPDMRYVKAALAIAKHVDNEIYLIEELIGEEDGGFEKYINNVYAVPLSTNDLQRKERGDFLAFTQHIQYTKTKKLAFVSDQQGESDLFCFVLMKFLKCPSFRWPQPSFRPTDNHLAVSNRFEKPQLLYY